MGRAKVAGKGDLELAHARAGPDPASLEGSRDGLDHLAIDQRAAEDDVGGIIHKPMTIIGGGILLGLHGEYPQEFSQCDLFIPRSAAVSVKCGPGDRVLAGETILAVY